MSHSNWSFSQDFSTKFQNARSEMESRISAAKSSTPSQELLPKLSMELAQLTKTLADATGSLPSYDQKQYEFQLKSLERSLESIRASSTSKSKFAFKRKAATPAQTNTSLLQGAIKDSESQPEISSSELPSTMLSISGYMNKYLTVESLSGPSQGSDLAISDLNNCIVNLATSTLTDSSSDGSIIPKLSALHVRNLSNSVLILPSVNGSALLHDLSRCVVILGCHQFRMHTSDKVDVYLSIKSNPIIEHCNNIRFSRYQHVIASPIEKTTKDFTVEDFSHIRATPSPHWSYQDRSQEATVWPISPLQQEDDVLRALAEILPPL